MPNQSDGNQNPRMKLTPIKSDISPALRALSRSERQARLEELYATDGPMPQEEALAGALEILHLEELDEEEAAATPPSGSSTPPQRELRPIAEICAELQKQREENGRRLREAAPRLAAWLKEEEATEAEAEVPEQEDGAGEQPQT